MVVVVAGRGLEIKSFWGGVIDTCIRSFIHSVHLFFSSVFFGSSSISYDDVG